MAEDQIRSLGEVSEKIIDKILVEAAKPGTVATRIYAHGETQDLQPAISKTEPSISRARPHEKAARLRAIIVYEAAKAENISQIEAVARYGSTRHSVSEAGLVFENGTAEEIALLRTGEVGLANVVRAIRERTPRDKIISKTPSPKPPWRGHAKRAEAKSVERFRIAMEFLIDGPPPKEMVLRCRANPTRQEMVNKNIGVARDWLVSFFDQWDQ